MAMSTAFPQPAPGAAPSPGPMKVEADRLKDARPRVHRTTTSTTRLPSPTCHSRTPAHRPELMGARSRDNFSFSPAAATVPVLG